MWVQEKGRGAPFGALCARNGLATLIKAASDRNQRCLCRRTQPGRPWRLLRSRGRESLAETSGLQPLLRGKSSASAGPGQTLSPVPGPRRAWASEHAQGWAPAALNPRPGCLTLPTPGSGILPSEPTQGSRTPSQRCSPAVSVLEMDPGVGESPAKPGQG